LSDHSQLSSLSVGLNWASRIVTIGLLFSLPAVIGYGFDRWFDSNPVGVLLGAILGFVLGMLQVMSLARSLNKSQFDSASVKSKHSRV